MFSVDERMLINAAIERIVSRSDDMHEAARIIVQFGSRLKNASRMRLSASVRAESTDDNISGYSPGVGEINAKDEKSKEETHHLELGCNKERVGHYRMWRERDTRICLQHFWKSELSTMSMDDEEPDEYVLGYDEETLTPQYVGIRRSRTLSIPWIGMSISTFYLDPIFGDMPHIPGFSINLF